MIYGGLRIYSMHLAISWKGGNFSEQNQKAEYDRNSYMLAIVS